MSMDEVHARTQAVLSTLRGFNEKLRGSFDEAARQHDRVNPLWQDAMRRDYDKRWQPLREAIEEYNSNVGPNHVEALEARLHEIIQYLHGDEH